LSCQPKAGVGLCLALNWLGSHDVSNLSYFHNLFSLMRLRSFGHPANWLCFFKIVLKLGLPFSVHSGLAGRKAVSAGLAPD
jgi:hypothetical protein